MKIFPLGLNLYSREELKYHDLCSEPSREYKNQVFNPVNLPTIKSVLLQCVSGKGVQILMKHNQASSVVSSPLSGPDISRYLQISKPACLHIPLKLVCSVSNISWIMSMLCQLLNTICYHMKLGFASDFKFSTSVSEEYHHTRVS